jgi:hypothetical protein
MAEKTQVERFDVTDGKAWEIALSRPVNSWTSPVVGFNCRMGYTCAVESFVSTTDRRILHVHSASGLPLVGTIHVRYTPQRLSELANRRVPAIRPSRAAS